MSLQEEETSIDGIDDLLYENGLLFTSVKEEPKKRQLIRRPKFIFLFNVFYFWQKLLVLFTEDEFTLSVICGDFTHYFGRPMKISSSASLVTWSLIKELNYLRMESLQFDCTSDLIFHNYVPLFPTQTQQYQQKYCSDERRHTIPQIQYNYLSLELCVSRDISIQPLLLVESLVLSLGYVGSRHHN